jgi:hypothetical protein
MEVVAGWVAGSAVEAMEVAAAVGSAAAALVEGAAVRRVAVDRVAGSAVAPVAMAGWVAMAEAVADWATPVEEAPLSEAYTS